MAWRREGAAIELQRRSGSKPGERLWAAFAAEDQYLAGLRIHLQSGSRQEVVRDFDSALRLAPWNDNLRSQILLYFWNMGGIFYLQGEYSAAVDSLRAAVEVSPNNGEVRYYLGLALLQTNQGERALEEMKKAVDSSPRLLPPRRYLAAAYLESREFDLAVENLEKILTFVPGDIYALVSYSMYLAEQRQAYSEAHQFLDRARRVAPEDPSVIDAMAWVEFLGGDSESALQIVREGGNYFEKAPEFRNHRDIILQGRPDGTLAD